MAATAAAKSSKADANISPSSFDCVVCISNMPTSLLVNHAEFDCLSSHTVAYRFATSAELKAHIAVEHLNYSPFQCERCPMVRFPTIAVLRRHYRFIHHIDEFESVFQVSQAIDEKHKELKIIVDKGRDAIAAAVLRHDNSKVASIQPLTIAEKRAELCLPRLFLQKMVENVEMLKLIARRNSALYGEICDYLVVNHC